MSDIEVLEPPPSRNLTTLRKVKLAMGITGEDADRDELLNDMIAAASDFVQRYCGRDFARQVVTESLPGKGTPDLILSITPIIDLIGVKFRGQEIEGVKVLDREAGFIQRSSGFTDTSFPYGTIDLAPSPYHRYSWEVTYEGGYILPGWGESQGVRTLPFDLERAVGEIVKSAFMSRNMDGNWKSYKIGETAISWLGASGVSTGTNAANAVAGIPQSALSVLQWYRRAF